MERESSLNTLSCDDPANRESGADARVLAANDGAIEDLHTLLVAFDNSHVNIHGITDMKLGETLGPDLVLLEIRDLVRHLVLPEPLLAGPHLVCHLASCQMLLCCFLATRLDPSVVASNSRAATSRSLRGLR